MKDNRLKDAEQIADHRDMILSVSVNKNLVAYAVQYENTVVTAFGCARENGDVAPVCILLPPNAWGNVAQLTDTHSAAVELPNAN